MSYACICRVCCCVALMVQPWWYFRSYTPAFGECIAALAAVPKAGFKKIRQMMKLSVICWLWVHPFLMCIVWTVHFVAGVLTGASRGNSHWCHMWGCRAFHTGIFSYGNALCGVPGWSVAWCSLAEFTLCAVHIWCWHALFAVLPSTSWGMITGFYVCEVGGR